MDHERKAMLGKQRRGGGAVRQIQLYEFEILGAGELRQPRFLQLRIVIRRQIIHTDDVTAVRHQTARHMKPNEAGGAGDKNGIYSRHGSTPSDLCLRSNLDFMSITATLLKHA